MVKKQIKWNQNKIDLITDRSKSAHELSLILGCTPHAIYVKRNKLGINFWKNKKQNYPKCKYPRSYKFHRLIILKLYPECQYCGKNKSTQADHFIPKSLGGTDHPANLIACCQPCNFMKGTRIMLDWLFTNA